MASISNALPTTGQAAEAGSGLAALNGPAVTGKPLTLREVLRAGGSPHKDAAAIDAALLPSLALERVFLKPFGSECRLTISPGLGSDVLTISGNGRTEQYPATVLLGETPHFGRTANLWAQTNEFRKQFRLPVTVSPEVVQIRTEGYQAGLEDFRYNVVVKRSGPDTRLRPGRIIAALASELEASPRVVLTYTGDRAGLGEAIYLLVDAPEYPPAAPGHELTVLKDCYNAIEDCFPEARACLKDPVAACLALGARFGLRTGIYKDEVGWIAGRTTLDTAGNALAILFRRGEGYRVPGLELGWSGHQWWPEALDPKLRPE